MDRARLFYESHIKWPLEFISLVAACIFFFVYWTEAEDRERAARLQMLQLTQLCNALASKIDGSDVWNYQEPRTDEEWDTSNAKLDERIAWLNTQCSTESLYNKPTRMLKPIPGPGYYERSKSLPAS